MTFKYGAGESLYTEAKHHRDEQQWSPAVYYDRPRCILCYRCIRMCGEGMDVWALGVQNRGAELRHRPLYIADGHPASSTANNAACASTCARWARSPAAAIATRRGPGR
jgi:NADH dehydrogenase/NADH:ubiquinone oxidoreductase subunit G